VEIRLQDYREVQGTFDAIVSVEMIEAVGETHWPEYFATLDRLLAPGGSRQHSGDHHGARAGPCHQAQLRMDPEVHLPRRS
jgi:2-polyprenyl-3-methyl-5-hydroxy-6-metoxy-1,4-benzoquinol methylase